MGAVRDIAEPEYVAGSTICGRQTASVLDACQECIVADGHAVLGVTNPLVLGLGEGLAPRPRRQPAERVVWCQKMDADLVGGSAHSIGVGGQEEEHAIDVGVRPYAAGEIHDFLDAAGVEEHTPEEARVGTHKVGVRGDKAEPARGAEQSDTQSQEEGVGVRGTVENIRPIGAQARLVRVGERGTVRGIGDDEGEAVGVTGSGIATLDPVGLVALRGHRRVVGNLIEWHPMRACEGVDIVDMEAAQLRAQTGVEGHLDQVEGLDE